MAISRAAMLAGGEGNLKRIAAAIHDAPRVSAELGHTSPTMLYNTYREVVRPEEAERYWKIAPVAENGNIVVFTASTSV